jgi:hypothetical protein
VTADDSFTNKEWQVIGRAIARLRASVMAVVFAMLGGGALFLATVVLVVNATEGMPVGPTLSLLNNYFPGYSVTWGGAFVGLIYGAVVGGLAGYVLTYVYNLVVETRHPQMKKG